MKRSTSARLWMDAFPIIVWHIYTQYGTAWSQCRLRAVRIESEGGVNEESIENASIHGRQIFKDLVVDPRRSSRAFWCIGYVMSNNSNISHFSSITLFYLFCESVLKDSFISLFAFPFDFLKGTAVFKVFELYSSPTKVYASVLYINCSVYVSGCGSTSSLGIFLPFF